MGEQKRMKCLGVFTVSASYEDRVNFLTTCFIAY